MALVRLFDIEGVPVLSDDTSTANVGKLLAVNRVNASGDVTEWVLLSPVAPGPAGGYGLSSYGTSGYGA